MARLDSIAYLPFLGLVVWRCNDALAPKGIPLPSLAFVLLLCCVTATSLLFLALKRCKLSKRSVVLTCLTAIIPVIGCFGLLTDADHSKYAFIADLASTSSLIIWTLFLSATQNRLNVGIAATIIGTGMFFASLLAIISAKLSLLPEYAWNGRWDPPHYLLSVILTTAIVINKRWRVFSSIVMTTCLAEAFFSGNRTQFVLFFSCFAMIFFIARPVTTVLAGLFILTIFAGFYTMLDQNSKLEITDYLTASRLDLVSSGVDDSNQGRINEARDALNIHVQSSTTRLLIGAGHGALWENTLSNPEMNIEHNGRIHNIHISFAAIIFRYGILGAALATGLIFKIFWDLVLQVGRYNPHKTAISVGAFAAVMASFTNNVFFDPIAIFLITWSLTQFLKDEPKPSNTSS